MSASFSRLGSLALILSATPAFSADLTKIDRQIEKEPPYTSKDPRYCLLVFGPKAAARCWLVADGEALYADRNCNGDLTEKEDRAERRVLGNGIAGFNVGEVVFGDDRVKAADSMFVLPSASSFISFNYNGKRRQTVSVDREGGLKFSSNPKEAPIVHFNGPLRMDLWYGSNKLLKRGESGTVLKAAAGTPGLGQGTFAYLLHENGNLPNGVQPVLDFEFPSAGAGTAPVKLRTTLKGRC